jgi:hypothetical protein
VFRVHVQPSRCRSPEGIGVSDLCLSKAVR